MKGEFVATIKSEFGDWFEAQHGKRNGCIQPDLVLEDGVKCGDACRAELERRRIWDEKRQSALYAWCARDTSKASASRSEP